tara:strand:+ start:54756 stop:60299 length:5544 start_codon:yes stop_codon:yes gene_type:complete
MKTKKMISKIILLISTLALGVVVLAEDVLNPLFDRRKLQKSQIKSPSEPIAKADEHLVKPVLSVAPAAIKQNKVESAEPLLVAGKIVAGKKTKVTLPVEKTIPPISPNAAEVNKVLAKENPREYTGGFPWNPKISVEGDAGNTRSMAITDLMIPIWGNWNNLLMMDVRAHAATDDTREGNVGLVYRFMPDENNIIGFYGYYDRSESSTNHYYSQATVGVQRLGQDWDFSGNGYIPFGKTRNLINAQQGSATLRGHNIILEDFFDTYEQAEAGFDLEAGRLLWGKPEYEMRGYAAYYHFGFGGDDTAIDGGRLRFQQSLSHYVRLTASVQYDAVRDWQYQFGVRLVFGGVSESLRKYDPTNLRNRMMTEVVRDIDIVTADKTLERDIDAPQKIYFVDEDATTVTGDGTYADPYSNLTQADIDAAGQGNIIYVYGGHATGQAPETYQLQSGLHFEANQDVITSGEAFNMQFDEHTVNLLPKTVSPIFEANNIGSAAPAIQLSSGDKIGHFSLITNATNSEGIDIANAQNVTLNNADVQGFQTGVTIEGPNTSNITVNNVQSNYNENKGFNISDIQHSLTLNNISATGQQQTGLMIQGSDHVTVTNSQNGVSNFNQNEVGVDVANSSHVHLGQISASDARLSGVELNNSNNVTINTVTANNSGADGVDITGGANNTLGIVTTNNNGADGVEITGASTNTSINTITANQNGLDGVAINGSTGVSVVNTVTADGNLGDGVLINNGSSNVSMNTIAAGQNILNGVAINDSTGVNVVNSVTADGNLSEGVLINNGSSDVSINTLQANDQTVFNGLLINNASDVSITSATTSGNANDGMQIDNNSSGITIGTAESDDNGQQGVSIAGASAVAMTNVTADSNTDNGVLINNSSNNVTIGTATTNTNSENGIDVSGDSGITLSNVTSTDNTDNGVLLSSAAGDNLGTVIATDNHQSGVAMTNSADVRVNSMTADDNRADGVALKNTSGVTLTNVVADRNTDDGVLIDSNSSSDNITTLTANHNKQSGVALNGAMGVGITTLTANHNTDDGVLINNNSSSDTIHTVAAADENGQNGVEFNDTGASNSIGTITEAEHNAGDGVDIDNGSHNVTLGDVIAKNNMGSGVNLNDASDINVSSLTADDNAATGLAVANKADDINVTQVSADNNATGISINDSSAVTLGSAQTTNLQVDSNTADGIDINNKSHNVALNGVWQAKDNQQIGVSINDATKVNVTGNDDFSDNDGLGISIADSKPLLSSNGITFANTDVSGKDNVGGGLLISNSNDVTMGDVTADQTSGTGVSIDNASHDITLGNVTADYAGNDGMQISDSNDVTTNNVEVNHAHSDGLLINNSDDVMMNNVTANKTGGTGVIINNTSSAVTLKNTTANNNAVDGIKLDDVAGINIGSSAAGVDVSANNNGANGIEIDNSQGNDTDINFNGNTTANNSISATDDSAEGLSVNNSQKIIFGGNSTLDGININNQGIASSNILTDAFEGNVISNNKTVTIENTDISDFLGNLTVNNAAGDGFVLTDDDDVSFNNGVVTVANATGTGINITDSQNVGFPRIDVTDSGADGFDMTNSDNEPNSSQFQGTVTSNGNIGDGVNIQNSGIGYTGTVTTNQNQGNGVVLNNLAQASELDVEAGSEMNNNDGAGLVIDNSNPTATANFTGVSLSGDGVELDNASNIVLSNSTINSAGVGVNVTGQSNVTLNDDAVTSQNYALQLNLATGSTFESNDGSFTTTDAPAEGQPTINVIFGGDTTGTNISMNDAQVYNVVTAPAAQGSLMTVNKGSPDESGTPATFEINNPDDFNGSVFNASTSQTLYVNGPGGGTVGPGVTKSFTIPNQAAPPPSDDNP